MDAISTHSTERPDECYEALFNEWPPASFAAKCTYGAHAAECLRYVLDGIGGPTTPNVTVIGEDQHTATLRAQIVEQIDGLTQEQIAQGLLGDFLQEILAKTILANLRSPATLDLLIMLGRKLRQVVEQ